MTQDDLKRHKMMINDLYNQIDQIDLSDLKWLRMTKNDLEWLRMTRNDLQWQRITKSNKSGKVWPTDRRTDGPMDQWTDGPTDGL